MSWYQRTFSRVVDWLRVGLYDAALYVASIRVAEREPLPEWTPPPPDTEWVKDRLRAAMLRDGYLALVTISDVRWACDHIEKWCGFRVVDIERAGRGGLRLVVDGYFIEEAAVIAALEDCCAAWTTVTWRYAEADAGRVAA